MVDDQPAQEQPAVERVLAVNDLCVLLLTAVHLQSGRQSELTAAARCCKAWLVAAAWLWGRAAEETCPKYCKMLQSLVADVITKNRPSSLGLRLCTYHSRWPTVLEESSFSGRRGTISLCDNLSRCDTSWAFGAEERFFLDDGIKFKVSETRFLLQICRPSGEVVFCGQLIYLPPEGRWKSRRRWTTGHWLATVVPETINTSFERAEAKTFRATLALISNDGIEAALIGVNEEQGLLSLSRNTPDTLMWEFWKAPPSIAGNLGYFLDLKIDCNFTAARFYHAQFRRGDFTCHQLTTYNSTLRAVPRLA